VASPTFTSLCFLPPEQSPSHFLISFYHGFFFSCSGTFGFLQALIGTCGNDLPPGAAPVVILSLVLSGSEGAAKDLSAAPLGTLVSVQKDPWTS
jgi:hypothetical protein